MFALYDCMTSEIISPESKEFIKTKETLRTSLLQLQDSGPDLSIAATCTIHHNPRVATEQIECLHIHNQPIKINLSKSGE